MSRKIILFELNEVPWRVLDDHVAAFPKGALAKVVGGGRTFVTHSEDISLTPWSAWPSLHRGVRDMMHGIGELGQDHSRMDREHPPVWNLLARGGVRVGVFGSLHTYPPPPDVRRFSFYVPDVFAEGIEAVPESLERFQEFTQALSRESVADSASRVPATSSMRFFTAARGMGLRVATGVELARHLAEEARAKWVRPRRRAYQFVVAFDLFLAQLRTSRPEFATFFTSHAASTLHNFWAARYPDDYADFHCPAAWVKRHKGEIEWAMKRTDAMLGALLVFLVNNPEYELWIASALGQAATEAPFVRNQVHVSDLTLFMRRLGAPLGSWRPRSGPLGPVMVEVDRDCRRAFATRLGEVRLADQVPLAWHQTGDGTFRIDVHEWIHPADDSCVLQGRKLRLGEVGLAGVAASGALVRTADHTREGVLIQFDPQRLCKVDERTDISAYELAPALLDRFGVRRPDYLRLGVAS